MTADDRIQRIEYVLGTLIGWLHGPALNTDDASTLLQMLAADDLANITHILNDKYREEKR